MTKKENKNQYTDNIVTGLSSATGGILGTVSANAAENYIKAEEYNGDDVIVVDHEDNTDDAVVVSPPAIHPSQELVIEQTLPETESGQSSLPVINVDYPEPNFVVEDVYAGPTPYPDTIDPNIDPIVCVYGPPEPETLNDLDNPTEDFYADL